MKERLLYNWHVVRIIYLLIGVLFSVYSIANKEWTGLLPGGYFMLMSIFHFGCATGGCYVPAIKQNRNKAVSAEQKRDETK